MLMQGNLPRRGSKSAVEKALLKGSFDYEPSQHGQSYKEESSEEEEDEEEDLSEEEKDSDLEVESVGLACLKKKQ